MDHADGTFGNVKVGMNSTDVIVVKAAIVGVGAIVATTKVAVAPGVDVGGPGVEAAPVQAVGTIAAARISKVTVRRMTRFPFDPSQGGQPEGGAALGGVAGVCAAAAAYGCIAREERPDNARLSTDQGMNGRGIYVRNLRRR